ncbi:c-type cytochrome [Prosthecomicrobium sp. N25]|uniref:c-type cytochrome n=1 Tax=Prosthecomicrobium sp. N25 TaxID=3129254 RepID=UPI0030779315
MSSGCRERRARCPRGLPSRVFGPAALLFLGLAACEREDREYRPNPVATETEERIAMTSLTAGPTTPEIYTTGKGKDFEQNAYHVSQGQKYFAWFNCNGCHANGGGDSGPALMDDTWIYGGAIENIVATIREGRPNGMPSFRGRIPDDQIWEIAAYIRSMGGNLPKDVAPSRRDDLHARPSENRLPAVEPKPGGSTPPAATQPQ